LGLFDRTKKGKKKAPRISGALVEPSRFICKKFVVSKKASSSVQVTVPKSLADNVAEQLGGRIKGKVYFDVGGERRTQHVGFKVKVNPNITKIVIDKNLASKLPREKGELGIGIGRNGIAYLIFIPSDRKMSSGQQ
jgi:hypothetical protein